MNIADYYINGLPEIGEWRDMHARIEGESVQELQKIFLRMWKKSTGEEINSQIYYPNNEDTLKIYEQENIAIVDRHPTKTSKVMRRVYAKAIETANNKVQIINPYFTPTNIITKAIKKALDKGVKVEIMIPGKSDIKFTPEAAFYIANKLRKEGADIYIFNGGFHHSKIMMIDSLYCTVGSTNLNSRSLRYDYEVNAFIFNQETTNEMTTLFNKDKENSTLLTRDVYLKRTPWKRFVGWFAHLLTPFL
jgi:cardiolipin synthase